LEAHATAIRPAMLERRRRDEHRVMATDEAIAMAKRLARDEGIFSGVSGGAAVAAAVAVAKEEAGRIVVLIADGGERYLSTPLWSEVMAVTVRLPGALRDVTGERPSSPHPARRCAR